VEEDVDLKFGTSSRGILQLPSATTRTAKPSNFRGMYPLPERRLDGSFSTTR
jgi:hypothetical protein